METVDAVVEIGSRGPGFSLASSTGAMVSMEDYRGKSSLVIYFVREFACLTCQMHAAGLARTYSEIKTAGAEVLVIGGGTPADAAKMAKRIKAPFPVLADPDRTVYESYNLPKALGLFQRSATVVIDRDGIVRYINRSTNPQFAIHTTELLAAVRQQSAR